MFGVFYCTLHRLYALSFLSDKIEVGSSLPSSYNSEQAADGVMKRKYPETRSRRKKKERRGEGCSIYVFTVLYYRFGMPLCTTPNQTTNRQRQTINIGERKRKKKKVRKGGRL